MGLAATSPAQEWLYSTRDTSGAFLGSSAVLRKIVFAVKKRSSPRIRSGARTHSRFFLTEYRSVLIEKIYRYGNGKPDELPMYSRFDFDGDGTAELLVWDIRVASSAFRDIYVYRYNSMTGKAEHIGTMIDFTGHSVMAVSRDGNGIVIAIRDAGKQDKITDYRLIGGRLALSVLLERTDETSQQWYDKTVSSEYSGGVTLETANTYDILESKFD